MRLETDKHINLEQLTQELASAGYINVSLSASDPGFKGNDRKEGSPGWIEITNGVDVPDFVNFVVAHVPQPRPKPRREELRERAQLGSLSPQELQEAVRLWLTSGSGGQ